MSHLWVLADLSEYDLASVRLGANVRLTVRSLPGRTFQGTIDLIYPQVDTQTRTTKVRIELPNPDGVLLPRGAEVDLHPALRGPDDCAASGGGRFPLATVRRAVGMDGCRMALGALLIPLGVSKWGLNPFFALLARARTREVMTAGALLVVLGAALLMAGAGLSMAMGAFLAGVILSSSSYRHQIESDIEPFRGLLMGLFFMAVGMSLDLSVVAAEWALLIVMLVAFTIAKGAVVYGVARLFGGSSHQAVHRTSMFLQGGEFAFVLYAAATAGGVIDQRENALFTTVVIFSMALTPLLMIAADRLLRSEASMQGVEAVLVIFITRVANSRPTTNDTTTART
ncbi:cation:proton antiporter [Rhizobium wenxiniae]|uniref:cation:proton antiporter domain-containing protein n=1 Tax=Rhizobium wenxiniae TaxID=1737357 RepID=UPI003D344D11